MKRLLLRSYGILQMFGVDPLLAGSSFARLPRFARELRAYSAHATDRRFPIRGRDLYPILGDYAAPAGTASGHYFHQDLWAARKIFAMRPARHVDVGSRVDGFVAHVLTFMPVEVIDVRKLESQVDGLKFVQDDATTLRSIADKSVVSLSSLHAVEHFGLGRYGDPVDPDGWLRGIQALKRVLAPQGRLYFAVPIGRERVEYNAHRIFSPHTIVEAFAGLQLVSFSAVDDSGRYRENARIADYVAAQYSCGLFELRAE